jgi:hypothetical protein
VNHSDVETGQRRWLMKAVREAAGELYGQFSGLKEKELRWRPEPGEWCLKEVAAHLRDAEDMYRRQIELIAQNREPALPYEPVDVLPYERDYRSESLTELLYEWEASREETVWLLRMLDEHDWERRGLHPHRGKISVLDIAREVHQHDLEHLWQVRKLRGEIERRRS